MGLLSRWKTRNAPRPPDISALERQAREQVWNREVARLGRDEVLRRLAALSDYRRGRTGRTGFESWSQQIDREIVSLAQALAGERHSSD